MKAKDAVIDMNQLTNEEVWEQALIEVGMRHMQEQELAKGIHGSSKPISNVHICEAISRGLGDPRMTEEMAEV